MITKCSQHVAATFTAITFMSTAFLGCGKKENDGKSFDAPAVRPPVAAASPDGFGGSASLGLTSGSELDEIKSRFYGAGPTDFLDRLAKIDSRIAEYETRSSSGDAPAKCLDEEAQLWNIQGLPGVGKFPVYLQCLETMTTPSSGTALKVGIGQKDGYWYIVELQNNATSNEPPTMGVLAKVKADGTEATVVQMSVETNYTTSIFHVYADQTNQVFELANASNRTSRNGTGSGPNYTGVGCGVRLKANATLVYGEGIFASENCLQTAVQVCADATSLTAKTTAADCTTAQLSTFGTVMNLTAAELGTESATNEAYLKVSSLIGGTGLPSLSKFGK